MNSIPTEEKKEETECDRKTTKYYALALTIIYVILFPFFFCVALISGMVLESPKITVFVGLSIIFAMFWIPLSMPISIYLMWFNFSRHRYKKSFFWGLLPLFTFAVVLFLVDGILPLFGF